MSTVAKLKETHPTAKKIRQLEELAAKLNLTISVLSYGQQLIINDAENDTEVQYRDAEQSCYGYESTTSFPCMFETKFILTSSIQ